MTKNRLKILYIITKSNWGGAQRYVYDLATRLPKSSFEAAVALGGDGLLKTKLENEGVRTFSIKNLERDINFAKEIGVFFRLLMLLIKERPDVVHLNSSKIGGLGGLAARLARVPRVIFTAHGWAFYEERGFFQQLAIKTASWLTVLFSHKTITVSEHDKRGARWMPFVKGKIEVVHNGIGSVEFTDENIARELLLKKAGLESKSGDFLIGTISELNKNKGLVYLIRAMTSLKKQGVRFLLLIIGGGEKEEELKDLIKELKLKKRVLLLGEIENAARYLKAFDVFALTSVKEGLPYTILEAGLSGTPVVASSVGGIPEIVDDMKTGILIRPKSPEEISKAISFLEEKPDKREELGTELKKEILAKFTLNQMAKKTIEFYRN